VELDLRGSVLSENISCKALGLKAPDMHEMTVVRGFMEGISLGAAFVVVGDGIAKLSFGSQHY
jgi:hypothetical protein